MKKMLSLVTLLMLGSSALHAAPGKNAAKKLQDRDLDGVIDKYDRCPNTPFFAIVNKNGCMIKRLKVSKDQERKIKELLSQNN